jgi:hypothetical protein
MAAPRRPTADDLAGVAACIEENDPTIRLRSARLSRTRDGAGEPSAPDTIERAPTPDDLAGIPVCAEEHEDLTIRPRKSATGSEKNKK